MTMRVVVTVSLIAGTACAAFFQVLKSRGQVYTEVLGLVTHSWKNDSFSECHMSRRCGTHSLLFLF